MKNKCKFLLTMVFIMVISSVKSYGLEAFNINSFDINMKVFEDNSYLIEESIVVEFTEKRHGIIRTIPLKTYRNERAKITGVKVKGHKFSEKKVSNDLEIKIGDPNKYANNIEEYIISYRYTIGDDGLKDMDELYWNLIGLDWDCWIDNITFTIEMPKGFSEERLNFTYGKKGSKNNERVEWLVEGNTIYGQLLDPLGPNEALTVALPLPEGYYSDVEKASLKGQGIEYIYITISFLIGFLIWLFLGKKRQSFPTVEFYPPQGINSGDAGFLIDGQVDPFDITSLIIYWADKGYLTISEIEEKKLFKNKKTFVLNKIKSIGNSGREYERYMFNQMFAYGDGHRVRLDELSNQFYLVADKVKREIVNSFEGNEETRIFTKSNGVSKWLIRIIGTLLTIPLTYAIVEDSGKNSGLESLGLGVIFSSLLMFAIFVNVILFVQFNNYGKKGRTKKIIFTISLLLIIGGTYIFMATSIGKVIPAILSLIFLVILNILSLKCNRRTDLGVWYEEKLIGFREFLKATEKDRIKMLVEENPQYFYNILPYAMVLRVTNKWAKNFDGIMTEPPSWYYPMDHRTVFTASSFAYNIENSMRNATDTIYQRPSSEGGGSSGGGSSGGGSGGGGGSSW